MKKRILAAAILLVCLSMVGYGTLAYFAHEDTAANIITAGNIRIALNQWALSEDGGSRVPYEAPGQVVPGQVVSRIVEVTNTGDHPAWIRVSVDKAIALAEGLEGQADTALIRLDLNTEFWYEQDGYYYYHAQLDPGETTVPLFTCVAFDADMHNLYQNSTAAITVRAQATQAANNGTTVFDAAGWPEDANREVNSHA